MERKDYKLELVRMENSYSYEIHTNDTKPTITPSIPEKSFTYKLPDPKPKAEPVIGGALVNEPVKIQVLSEPQTQSYIQNPPNITYAGGRPIYLTDAEVQADVGLWAFYPASQDVDLANFNLINGATGSFQDITGVNGTIENLNVSSGTITLSDTAGVQTLQAIGTDLFYDGQLLAKAGDIQNISDWSLYPAIANIDLNSNSIVDGSQTILSANPTILSGTNIELNSSNITGVTGSALSVDQIKNVGGNFGTNGQVLSSNGTKLEWIDNDYDWSSFPATQTVDLANNSLNNVSGINLVSGANTAILTAGAGDVLNVNGVPVSPASTWSSYPATETVNLANNSLNNVSGINLVSGANTAILTTGAGDVLNVNGVPVSGDASGWANFPAVANVVIPDHDLNMTTTTGGLAYNNANINANLVIGNTSQAPIRPDATFYVGNMNIGGLANPVTDMNVYSLGGVNIDSLLGVSVSGGGGVAVSGAGGLSVTGTGAVSVASLGGVLISGGGGVAITGEGNVSVSGGNVEIASGNLLMASGTATLTSGNLAVVSGAVEIGNVTTLGGGLGVYGTDITLYDVGPTASSLVTNKIDSRTPLGLNITGVATINGSPYVSNPVDFTGLLNKINAYPALPYTSSSSSTPSANQVPTAIVPDGSFPVNVPTVGLVQGGWGFSKPIGSPSYFNWYMYNPRFGNPSAPLPYIKSKIHSVWALIRPTVNLYSAGYLGLNLYSYDPTNIPTSGFFNSRWAYSNSVGTVAGASGVNLFAGYTYLIYANDTPRITNLSAIGVPDNQVSTLRDPYDIYTDVNHIALSNCVVAFNPWTNGTNFKTWSATPLTPFITGDTVIFAGQGTNYNGLFFIATGIPAPATPPMVNGVVSANWSLISPQPSSYADQPILSMNITQSTASGQAVGYVVLDMGFSYGPSTTSTTVSEHISLPPN
jgi:hypothetical protein